jgi:hypothetical protein
VVRPDFWSIGGEQNAAPACSSGRSWGESTSRYGLGADPGCDGSVGGAGGPPLGAVAAGLVVVLEPGVLAGVDWLPDPAGAPAGATGATVAGPPLKLNACVMNARTTTAMSATKSTPSTVDGPYALSPAA